jgi:hypothetical protein
MRPSCSHLWNLFKKNNYNFILINFLGEPPVSPRLRVNSKTFLTEPQDTEASHRARPLTLDPRLS